jgi:regulator of protease activity HflC (stomatin/prohibitin superfamily)
MSILIISLSIWFIVRIIATGFYTVDQNERAVKTVFGRAQRLGQATTASTQLAQTLNDDERQRYDWPQLQVVQPGGPYFKWPWEKVHKVSTAIFTVNIAYDPDDPQANHGGKMLEAVTKDHLNTGLIGQIRYSVSERNLYPFLFGIHNPVSHIMGYFVSILRERIANFEAPKGLVIDGSLEGSRVQGISINDLRKNLSDLNVHMERECASSEARYGVVLNAALITGIEPPHEVESALAAINTAHNQVSSEISLAQASADQKIVQSRRAVEIETLKAEAEVQMLKKLADQLLLLKKNGKAAIQSYVRNVKLELYRNTKRAVIEIERN